MADPEQQQALSDAIKAHPELLFKAAEHAVGKRRQTLELNPAEFRMMQWPDKPGHRRVVVHWPLA